MSWIVPSCRTAYLVEHDVKIRGKIYLIVGVMGLISVLVGGIAVHVVSEYSAKLERYQNAYGQK